MEVLRVLTSNLLSGLKVACFDAHDQYLALATIDNRLVHGHLLQKLYERKLTDAVVQVAVGRSGSRLLVVSASRKGVITLIYSDINDDTHDIHDDIDNDNMDNKEEVNLFDVLEGHVITAIYLDSSNDVKRVYVGTRSGAVTVFLLEEDCVVSRILELGCPVLQLSCSQNLLVVSTDKNTVVCDNLNKTFRQIGNKPRQGNFGAILCPSGLKIFCARPGCRLWQCDSSGSLEHTLELKSILEQLSPLMKLDMTTNTQRTLDNFFPFAKNNNSVHSFSKMLYLRVENELKKDENEENDVIYHKDLLITFNANHIYAINTLNISQSTIVLSIKSGILDVKTSLNRIWVLSRSGELVVLEVKTKQELEEDTEQRSLPKSSSDVWQRSQQLVSSVVSTISNEHLPERANNIKSRTQSLLQRTGDSLYSKADQLLDLNRLENRLKAHETKIRAIEVAEFILSFDKPTLNSEKLMESIHIFLETYQDLCLLTKWNIRDLLEPKHTKIIIEVITFLLKNIDVLDSALAVRDARVLDTIDLLNLDKFSEWDWKCRSLLIIFEDILTLEHLASILGHLDRPLFNTWAWLSFRTTFEFEQQLMKRATTVIEREQALENLIHHYIVREEIDLNFDVGQKVDQGQEDVRRRLRGTAVGLSLLLLELFGSKRAMTLLRQQSSIISAQDVFFMHLLVQNERLKQTETLLPVNNSDEENLFVEIVAKVASLQPFTTERLLSSNENMKNELIECLEKWIKEKREDRITLNNNIIMELTKMHPLLLMLVKFVELQKRLKICKNFCLWTQYEKDLFELSKEEIIINEMETILELENASDLIMKLGLLDEIETCSKLVQIMCRDDVQFSFAWDEFGIQIIRRNGLDKGLRILEVLAPQLPHKSFSSKFYLSLIRERLRRRKRSRQLNPR